jgi:HEAT repeat protein
MGPGSRPSTGRAPGALTAGQKNAAAREDKKEWTEWWHFNQWRFTRISNKQTVSTGKGEASGSTGARDLEEFLTTKGLADDHYDPVSAAALALGKMKATKSKKQLEKLVQDRKAHKYVRESAALALGMMESTTSAPLLTHVLYDQSQDTRLRVHAAIGLGLLKDPSIVPQLLQVLARQDDREVHVASTIALGLIGDGSAATRVLGILKSRQTHNTVRACATMALGKIGDEKVGNTDVIGLMRTLVLSDRDDDVRRSVALVLYRFLKEKPSSEARATVIETLDRVARNDGDDVTRGFAMIGYAQALQLKADSNERRAAMALFSARLFNGESREKGYAAIALGLLGKDDRDCAKPLRQAFMAESKWSTRSAIAIGLGLMQDAASKQMIADVVNTQGNPDLRGYCCVSLGLMGGADPDISKYLTEIVKNVNVPELKAAAAMALAKLGNNAEAMETLRASIKDRNRYFKMSALMAIGHFRDYSTIADLQEQFKRESNAEARAIAVVAMGFIGEKERTPILSQISEDFNFHTVFLSMPAVDQIIRLF